MTGVLFIKTLSLDGDIISNVWFILCAPSSPNGAYITFFQMERGDYSVYPAILGKSFLGTPLLVPMILLQGHGALPECSPLLSWPWNTCTSPTILVNEARGTGTLSLSEHPTSLPGHPRASRTHGESPRIPCEPP